MLNWPHCSLTMSQNTHSGPFIMLGMYPAKRCKLKLALGGEGKGEDAIVTLTTEHTNNCSTTRQLQTTAGCEHTLTHRLGSGLANLATTKLVCIARSEAEGQTPPLRRLHTLCGMFPPHLPAAREV